ncbi:MULTISPECIES: AraC family transcriptional regulator [Pseudomonas]|uniref:AraC family transcriptional regulator n=1 Tax=Pseudomonas sessilinigenes TaxID=658629 RepID=A0ABX8MXC1_9PSED|nr:MULTISPECIES: AraC family transcriptional regulator [Pseudomonas]AZC24166.1 Transcriptional regulator, AraC family [Pseudomonas sessilinigenes]QIH08652.1 AraC family transcriptional regulator [Pseudomonas sp. BIOMIG1BAC]QXH43125.1 AraC family transcriptional regulator [Pseudomonas sessilinigenes]
MRETDSVAAYYLQVMTHALHQRPARLAAVLAEAGIDPALLQQPRARVSGSAFAALWLIQIRELQDEFFQLDSHGLPPGAFALICRGLIQEPNLEKALRQCLNNFSLFLRDFGGTLSVRGKRAVISLHSRCQEPGRGHYGEETLLVLIISLLCWLGGRRIPIDRAEFRHARLSLDDDALLWGSNLTWNAGRTEIEFASRLLRLPVVQDLASLKVFLRSAPQWLVIRFRNQHGLTTQVHQRLRSSHYSQWPTLEAFAQEVQMSPSTLRRRLEREGGSYQEIKDEVRRNVAVDLLRRSAASIGEIAELTGFQEPSAFHRAFKKWTGESPGRYRARFNPTL